MNSPNTDFGERDEAKTEEDISLYTVIAIDTILFASLIFYEKISLPSRTKTVYRYMGNSRIFRRKQIVSYPSVSGFQKSEHYIEVDFNIESIWSIQTLM